MNRASAKSLALSVAWALGICGGIAGLLSLPGRSRGGPDIHYAYKSAEGQPLTLAVYLPRNWKPTDRRPCVIWFFGGGYETGSPIQFSEASRRLARAGMVAIAADYRVKARHGAGVTPLDAVRDARSAARWVIRQAGRLGIDPARLAAGGGSSGGQLALACAMLDGPDDPGEDPAIVPAPAALVLFNPVVDFDIPFVREMSTNAQFQELLAISPRQRLARPLPPTLILHGEADRVVPLRSVEQFVALANSLGSPGIALEIFPGRGHEFHLPDSRGNRDFDRAMNRVEVFFGELGWIAPPPTAP